jgi:hypothetical protein
MSQVLYALVPAANVSVVIRELTQKDGERRPFAVYEHCGGELDTLALPTHATEVGKNTAMATGFGAAAGAFIGVIMGMTKLVLGVDVVMGALLGLIFGGLVGVLCGLMAGTRRAKPGLIAAARDANAGQSLLIIECAESSDEARAEQALESVHPLKWTRLN